MGLGNRIPLRRGMKDKVKNDERKSSKSDSVLQATKHWIFGHVENQAAQSPELQTELTRTHIRNILAVTRIIPLVMLCIGIGLAYIFKPQYSETLVVAWIVTFTITCFIAIFTQEKHFTTLSTSKQPIDNLISKTALTTLVYTTLYCAIVPLFINFEYAAEANGSLFVNMIAGQLLISAVATFANRIIFLSATIPSFATLILFDFYPNSESEPARYLAAILGYCSILYIARHARKIFSDNLVVKIQHDKLIQDLASEKAKSDASLYRIEHANKRLLQSEQLFRALVDNTFDTTLLTDKHGHIRYASPSCRQIGLTANELVGQPVQSIFKLQSRSKGLDWLNDTGADGSHSIQFKESIIGNHGEAVWVEGSLRDLRQEPNVEGLILNLRNITERKHADDELRIHLRVLDALATSKSLDEVLELLCHSLDQSLADAQAGIILLDEDMVVTKSILPSVDGNFEDLIPQGPLNPDDHAMARALQTGKPIFIENADTSHLTQAVAEVQKRKGKTFKGMWTFPIYDRQAKPLGSVNLLLATARQPTDRERALLHSAIHLINLAVERRQSEDDLLRATERAEMANRAKSSFLATMSHELRTPLNAIIGFSDIMKGEMFGPLENERYADYTNDIYNSGRHLLAVIDDILDISKIEAGRYDVEESEVAIIDVINWSADLIRPKIHEKKQTLTIGVIHNAKLWVDQRAARQVFLNLLSNAVKFTPEGGNIQVLGNVAKSGDLEILIIDNGIGIPAEMIEMVMQPFAQVNSHTAREFEGTGLGLPICKSLLELHDGSIRIKSEQGEGTTVTLTLPKERLVSYQEKMLNA